MAEEKQKNANFISLENREKLNVTGVFDVDSFDEHSIAAYTDYGQLNIQGEQLNIKHLSVESGDLVVEGIITGLIYTDNRPRESFVKRLFR